MKTVLILSLACMMCLLVGCGSKKPKGGGGGAGGGGGPKQQQPRDRDRDDNDRRTPIGDDLERQGIQPFDSGPGTQSDFSNPSTPEENTTPEDTSPSVETPSEESPGDKPTAPVGGPTGTTAPTGPTGRFDDGSRPHVETARRHPTAPPSREIAEESTH